jgi:hypothetical protein
VAVRGRYVQRLSAADVGSRVSVRRWVEDPERGMRPSDVVGRLVAWSEDDVLTIRRRSGEHVDVPLAEVLASRVVPEHPTLPPE